MPSERSVESSGVHDSRDDLPSHIPRLTAIARVVTVALGLSQAFLARTAFSSDDAVSYLDVADAYRQHHWHAAINTYWSPLYSWILAVAGGLIRPEPSNEIMFVRWVNVVLYVGTMAAFERFWWRLREVHTVASARTATPPIPAIAWLIVGYSTFAYASLHWIGVRSDTPDLLVSALVYIMAAILLDLHHGRRSRSHIIALGLVGGTSYLAKTAMGPLAILVTLVGSRAAGRRHMIGYAVVGLSAFSAVAMPVVLVLSVRYGRPTIGNAGVLNYAWFVNPTRRAIPDEHWQGGPAAYGRPLHPTRHLWANPDVFEFGGPIGGTYPPWTDPSYWYDGLVLHFDPATQWRVARENLLFYWNMFGPIVIALIAVAWVQRTRRVPAFHGLRDYLTVLITGTAGLVEYLVDTNLLAASGPGQTSTRLVAPFVVLLLSGLFAALRVRATAQRAAVSMIALAAAVGTAVATHTMITTWHDPETQRNPMATPLTIATALHRIGVQRGAAVAILGRKFDRDHDHEFWARLARVHIICHVPDDQRALTLSTSEWHELVLVLARAGARVLVYKASPDDSLDADWLSLGAGYYAYLLPTRRGEG
jgi:hypothetical protein